MPKERNDAGRYVETATPEDVLAVFDAVDGPPVVTSADAADETGLSRDSARRKLETLHDRGEVSKRRTAGRVLYWPVGWDRRQIADESGRENGQESASTPSRERGDPSDGLRAGDLQGDPETTLADETPATDDEHLAEIDSLSFDRTLTESRREVLAAWHRHVRDAGEGVKKSDFESWWTDDRADRTEYGAGSFWKAFAKASMKESDKFDKPNLRTYRWVGDAGGGADT